MQNSSHQATQNQILKNPHPIIPFLLLSQRYKNLLKFFYSTVFIGKWDMLGLIWWIIREEPYAIKSSVVSVRMILIKVFLAKNVFFAPAWSIPHCVCVGRLIDLESVQKSFVQPPKSWSRLQALNKGVIEVLEVEVRVCRWEGAASYVSTPPTPASNCRHWHGRLLILIIIVVMMLLVQMKG